MARGSDGVFGLSGSENNRVKVGGRTELFGDPKIRPEKPYTIIAFPGGDVEVSRTTDGNYWVHVAVRDWPDGDGKVGRLIGARIDPAGRYADAANAALTAEIEQGDVAHIAFLITPHRKD